MSEPGERMLQYHSNGHVSVGQRENIYWPNDGPPFKLTIKEEKEDTPRATFDVIAPLRDSNSVVPAHPDLLKAGELYGTEVPVFEGGRDDARSPQLAKASEGCGEFAACNGTANTDGSFILLPNISDWVEEKAEIKKMLPILPAVIPEAASSNISSLSGSPLATPSSVDSVFIGTDLTKTDVPANAVPTSNFSSSEASTPLASPAPNTESITGCENPAATARRGPSPRTTSKFYVDPMQELDNIKESLRRFVLLSEMLPCKKAICVERKRDFRRMKEAAAQAKKPVDRKNAQISLCVRSIYRIRHAVMKVSKLLIEMRAGTELATSLIEQLDLIKAEEKQNVYENYGISDLFSRMSYNAVFPEGHRAFAARVLEKVRDYSPTPELPEAQRISAAHAYHEFAAHLPAPHVDVRNQRLNATLPNRITDGTCRAVGNRISPSGRPSDNPSAARSTCSHKASVGAGHQEKGSTHVAKRNPPSAYMEYKPSNEDGDDIITISDDDVDKPSIKKYSNVGFNGGPSVSSCSFTPSCEKSCFVHLPLFATPKRVMRRRNIIPPHIDIFPGVSRMYIRMLDKVADSRNIVRRLAYEVTYDTIMPKQNYQIFFTMESFTGPPQETWFHIGKEVCNVKGQNRIILDFHRDQIILVGERLHLSGFVELPGGKRGPWANVCTVLIGGVL